MENKNWGVGVWIGEAVGVHTSYYDYSIARITMAGFDLSRVVAGALTDDDRRQTLEYIFEAQPLFLLTNAQIIYGGGFSPLGLRWNFARRGRYRPYVEWNGGGMFTLDDIPPGQTRTFNFTTSIGPGLMINTHPNQAISIGVRFWHLSNAGTGRTNPSINALQVVIGYHWLKLNRLFP